MPCPAVRSAKHRRRTEHDNHFILIPLSWQGAFFGLPGADVSDEIDTGGGAGVGGNVRAGRDYVGRDSIIYADTYTWRNFVTRDIEGIRSQFNSRNAELKEEIAELKGRVMFLLIVVFLIFTLGAISTAFTIRQFDQIMNRSSYDSRRIDMLERSQDRIFPGP